MLTIAEIGACLHDLKCSPKTVVQCYQRNTYRVRYNNHALYVPGDRCWRDKYLSMCGEQTGYGFLTYPTHPNYRGYACDWEVGTEHVLTGHETIDNFADWASVWTANDPWGNTWTEVPDSGVGVRCGPHIETITTHPAALGYGEATVKRNWRNYTTRIYPSIDILDIEYFYKLVDTDGKVLWLDCDGIEQTEQPEHAFLCGQAEQQPGLDVTAPFRIPRCQSVRVCPEPMIVPREGFCAVYNGQFVTLIELVDTANNNSYAGEYWVDAITGEEVQIPGDALLEECGDDAPVTTTINTCYMYVGELCGEPSVNAVKDCILSVFESTVTRGGAIIGSYTTYFLDGEPVEASPLPDLTNISQWQEVCCESKTSPPEKKTFIRCKMYRYSQPENGVQAQFWGDALLGGNAAPHANVSTLWTDADTHINGAPDLAGVIPLITTDWNVVDQIDPFGANPFSAASTGRPRSGFGTDQYSQRTWLIANQATMFRDNNRNTGERIGVYVGTCGCDLELVKEVTIDSGTQGTPAALGEFFTAAPGIVCVDAKVADLSAWSGFQLQISTDGGETWRQPDPSDFYAAEPVLTEMMVYVCEQTGEIFSFPDKGTRIEFNEKTDFWCDPRCLPSPCK